MSGRWTTSFYSSKRCSSPRADPLLHRSLGRLHPASGPRGALPGQTEHAANRAEAFDVTDTYFKRLVRKTICFSKTTQMMTS